MLFFNLNKIIRLERLSPQGPAAGDDELLLAGLGSETHDTFQIDAAAPAKLTPGGLTMSQHPWPGAAPNRSLNS